MPLIFFSNFVIVMINISNWTSCRTIQGVIVLVISNWPRALRSADFEITRLITPWILTLLGPITITKLLWNRSQLTAVLQNYCIFCSIRQPFKSEESFQKIDLDLYTELQFHLPFCREKRDFVSGGAAAGVAGITLPSSETYFTQVYFTPVTVPKEPI